MNNRNKEPSGAAMGYLPTAAPLANPYVPFQAEDPPKYPAGKGLIRGTIYPGLDLPFRGMVNRTEKPLTPGSLVQSTAFAVQELSLYLDTHPEDQQALAQYRSYQDQYRQAVQNYSRHYGPLNHSQTQQQNRYLWLQGPWPWEYAANQEV